MLGCHHPACVRACRVVARILMEDDDTTEDQLDYKSVGDAPLIGV